MVDALKSILDFFGTLLDFVEYLVTGLVQLITMIPSAFAMLTYSIGYLCSWPLPLSLLLCPFFS